MFTEKLWNPNYRYKEDYYCSSYTHGRSSVGRPTRTYLDHLWTDTECSWEDLPRAIDDRDGWREKEGEREIKWEKYKRVDDNDEYDDDDCSSTKIGIK